MLYVTIFSLGVVGDRFAFSWGVTPWAWGDVSRSFGSSFSAGIFSFSILSLNSPTIMSLTCYYLNKVKVYIKGRVLK